jgi:arylsulfatase A-like enzyme
LISLDTLRPSALGCYGHDRPTSPTLDRLAHEGVVFENAMATSPWTLPSHASLLTGLYPRRHAVKTDRHRLPAQIVTWAQLLEERGFATAAIVNSGFVSRRYGFGRGFADFEYVREKRSRNQPFEVTRRALQWLSERGDAPFFLFVHDYQIHSDYAALPHYQELFVRPYAGPANGTTMQLGRIRSGRLQLKARDVEHLLDLYSAGVRQTDEQIDRLLRHLEESDRLDETLVIVTSDHGEEFLEHGGVLHGRTYYEEILHIPLIFYGPSLPSGQRIADPVSLVDVLPTALALLGVSAPSQIDGVDLSPLWGNASSQNLADRLLFAEADHNNEEPDMLRAVRHGRHKLIHNRLTGRSELYDLASDPEEQSDLSAEQPEMARRLLDQLQGSFPPDIEAEPLPEISPEWRQELEALGYGAESAADPAPPRRTSDDP